MPPAQTFLAIPEHRELARRWRPTTSALQTQADVANLIDYLQHGVCGRILQDGRISAFDRVLAIASFPVGIDRQDFVSANPRHRRWRKAPAGCSRIIGIDRLDYTKGLPQKFRAFGRFLESIPTTAARWC